MAIQTQLWAGDVRQVMVTGMPGVKSLPCMPNPGCNHLRASIPNGTFVTFVRVVNFTADPDGAMWLMYFTDMPQVEVLITPDALRQGWLWKAKRPKALNLLVRRGRR